MMVFQKTEYFRNIREHTSSVQKGAQFDMFEKSQYFFCMQKLATNKNSCIFSEYSQLHHLYEHDNALTSCFLPKDNMVSQFYCSMTKN